MGGLAAGPAMRAAGWALFGVISAANLWLLCTLLDLNGLAFAAQPPMDGGDGRDRSPRGAVQRQL